MEERSMEIKVGILVIVSLALFAGFMIALGDFQTTQGVSIRADFPASAGLKVGAGVKITGFTVGQVTDVQFWGGRRDEANDKRVQVRVEMEITPAYFETIAEDARAYITTRGILGEKYVEISPGTIDAPRVEPGAVIEGVEPLRLEIVARDLSITLSEVSRILQENRRTIAEILVRVNDTVKHVDDIVLGNSDRIEQMLSSLESSVSRADALLESAQKGLGDGGDLRATLENARRLTGRLRAAVPGVVGRVEGTLDAFGSVAGTYQSIGEDGHVRILSLLDRAENILKDAKELSGGVRKGEGTLGALLADQDLYDDLRELLADLRRHPWKVIWKE
jgi:phospholipid/cholesterol/gamma-HCH transport system substrate-binding protein